MDRFCTRCKKEVPANGRYLKRGKPASECKECSKERCRIARAAQPTKSRSEVAVQALAKKNRGIDPEKFRAVLRRFKAEHGMTWSEMANRLGISRARLNTIMYDIKKTPQTGYGKQEVEDMLRRLHGLPAPPSKHMLNKYNKDKKRVVYLPGGAGMFQPCGNQHELSKKKP